MEKKLARQMDREREKEKKVVKEGWKNNKQTIKIIRGKKNTIDVDVPSRKN